jgi:hypothetical protein
MQKTFKTAYNRGNARVWIEGDILKTNGFRHGRRFKRVMIDYTAICDGQKRNAPVMSLQFADVKDTDKRKGKIAGTAARPIVDLNGKFLTEFMDGATHYLATFKNDTITIERA